MSYNEFGLLARKTRKENGLSVSDVARQLGVSASHLYSIENGDYPVTRRLMKPLIKALDMDSDAAYAAAGICPPELIKDLSVAIKAYRHYRGLRDA